MDKRIVKSREAVLQAREALRRGNTKAAYDWAQRAAEVNPHNEDAWLLLAALVEPRASLDYIHRALQINPESERARKGQAWAERRLRSETPLRAIEPSQPFSALRDLTAIPSSTSQSHPTSQNVQGARKIREGRGRKKSYLLPIVVTLFGCTLAAYALWSAVNSPVLASILNFQTAPVAETPGGRLFAQVDIPKPTYTAPALAALVPTATPGSMAAELLEQPAAEPILSPVPLPSSTEAGMADDPGLVAIDPVENISTPTSTIDPQIEAVPGEPVESPSPAGPTETPGVMVAEIIPDTPTPEYVPPTEAPPEPAPPAYASGSGGVHWIDVDLSQQRLYAYEGDTQVNSFLVSTGTWQTPTVTGKYKIWIKLRTSDMTGPGYYLPDVPYVMYFYGDYGLHGTYWHNNFGTPMSHGCVNLSIPDAAWLYDFSRVGTVVNVHY